MATIVLNETDAMLLASAASERASAARENKNYASASYWYKLSARLWREAGYLNCEATMLRSAELCGARYRGTLA